jgi:hypothetical protein
MSPEEVKKNGLELLQVHAPKLYERAMKAAKPEQDQSE